ncbi:MAG: methyltransferase [Burkholderiaceae bacterium]
MSFALVTAQMLLIAVLAWPSSVPALEARSLIGALLILGAIALALWALAAMRLHTFSVMPEPVAGARLCQRGPYARIRHPMYCAVLAGGAGALLIWPVTWKLIAWILLGIVLAMKIRREERLLMTVYADYASYRERTHALFPGLL